jgi:hypothetical protein
MTTIQERYQAYVQECQKTDTGRHGSVLREMTPLESKLYSEWQQAIRDCRTWRHGDTTWHILDRYQDGVEMWHCRIIIPEYPDGMIADCYASYIRQSAQPVED